MNEPEKESWGLSRFYDQYVGRWSREVAKGFLEWLDIPRGQVWGDVGCGTGALAGQIIHTSDPKSVFAVDRSKGFLDDARRNIEDPRVGVAAANALTLPWPAGLLDVSASGLVLNFVPDAAAMAQEMARVTRPNGRVAAYVWDYSGGMEMMRNFWDAAIQVDTQAASLDQAERFPLCRPDPLKDLFREAGLASIEVRAIDIPTVFRDFDDYWLPFLGKQGSAPTYLASLDSARRERIRDILKARLVPAVDGSIHLTARAWAVQGRV